MAMRLEKRTSIYMPIADRNRIRPRAPQRWTRQRFLKLFDEPWSRTLPGAETHQMGRGRLTIDEVERQSRQVADQGHESGTGGIAFV